MTKNHALDWQEARLLPAFSEACHDASSREEFLASVYPILRDLLPHEKFACGIVFTKDSVVQESFSINLPNGLLDGLGFDAERMCPLFSRWAQTQQPVFFDESSIFAQDDPNLLVTFKDLGLHYFAGHGVMDLSQQAASCFGFSRRERWSEGDERTLRLVVPHLHVALSRCARSGAASAKTAPSGKPLSAREREILGWICIGKSNVEIACILGISAWTVKVHVSNLMKNLVVSTRSHAVAKALALGFVPSPAFTDLQAQNDPLPKAMKHAPSPVRSSRRAVTW